MLVPLDEVTAHVFSRFPQAFSIQMRPALSIHFRRQSDMSIIVRSYTTHVLSWSQGLTLQTFIISLVEMLCQVMSILPHCGLLKKFYELLILKTILVFKEMPTLPETVVCSGERKPCVTSTATLCILSVHESRSRGNQQIEPLAS